MWKGGREKKTPNNNNGNQFKSNVIWFLLSCNIGWAFVSLYRVHLLLLLPVRPLLSSLLFFFFVCAYVCAPCERVLLLFLVFVFVWILCRLLMYADYGCCRSRRVYYCDDEKREKKTILICRCELYTQLSLMKRSARMTWRETKYVENSFMLLKMNRRNEDVVEEPEPKRKKNTLTEKQEHSSGVVLCMCLLFGSLLTRYRVWFYSAMVATRNVHFSVDELGTR